MVTKAKILSAVASLMCPTFQVSDQPEETHEKDVQVLADIGPCVCVDKTEPGKPQSVKVVGQARISNDLGKAKGMEIAQQQAKARALEELTDWIQSNAKSTAGDGIEGVTILEEKDPDKQSQASENTPSDVTAKADAIIRDLVLEDQHVDANGEFLTLIYAWRPAHAEQAPEAAEANPDDHAAGPAEAKPVSKPSDTPVKIANDSPDFHD